MAGTQTINGDDEEPPRKLRKTGDPERGIAGKGEWKVQLEKISDDNAEVIKKQAEEEKNKALKELTERVCFFFIIFHGLIHFNPFAAKAI